jgi:hypothetical protein
MMSRRLFFFWLMGLIALIITRPRSPAQQQQQLVVAMVVVGLCRNSVPRTADYVAVIIAPHPNERTRAYALGQSLRAQHSWIDRLVLQQGADEPVAPWTACHLLHPSPMRAWALVDYKGVLLLHLNTLVVAPLGDLFTLHLPRLNGTDVGAVSGPPCAHTTNISTAVLLIAPSLTGYLRLRKRQRLLGPGARLADLIRAPHPLPPRFNADVAWRTLCWWRSPRILRFTGAAQPWASLLSYRSWGCWATGVDDLCALWWRALYCTHTCTYASAPSTPTPTSSDRLSSPT